MNEWMTEWMTVYGAESEKTSVSSLITEHSFKFTVSDNDFCVKLKIKQ